MAYRVAAIQATLSVLQGYLLTASFSKCEFYVQLCNS